MKDTSIQIQNKNFEERKDELKKERVDVQKKTFTKWCNLYLTKVRKYSAINKERFDVYD